MPLEAPKLDTRTFEQIFAAARLRIPRYTPEWTDFNESDPGITLLQLFSWLTELQLYELNRVPDRSYVKFLQLLGLQLEPAQPARADLTFTAGAGAAVGPVPARTQVTAPPPEGGPPLVFETSDGLSLVRVPLVDVQVYDGTAYTVVSAANAAAESSFRPLGWVPQIGSALYLGFAQTNPPALDPVFPPEVRLRAFLPLAGHRGAPVSCSEAEHPPLPPVRLAWEAKPSAGAPAWRELNVFEDETGALTREGYIVLEGPREIALTTEGQVAEPRFWLRCRIVSGAYSAGRSPEVEAIRPNTVPAENLSTVHDELVGTSEGLPGQTFELRRRPVRAGTLELLVGDETVPLAEWKLVEDFLASGSDDSHYTLDETASVVAFGDGRRGRIPVAGAEIVARTYRFGGGTAGNVGAGEIAGLLTKIAGVEEVTNERPAVGGRDEQSVEDLKQRAPRTLRHRGRAVTAEDFAALAERAGGIVKATAIALAHPDHPGIEVPGAVTVVVVPDTEDVPPQPSSDLVRHVCRYLSSYRLLTSEVFVKGPAYQAVKVEARIAAEPYAAFDAVKRDVIAALDSALEPLTRGFGEELYPTSLYSVILRVKGVAAVPALALVVDGRPHELTKAIVLPRDGLVYGARHEIVVEPRIDL